MTETKPDKTLAEKVGSYIERLTAHYTSPPVKLRAKMVAYLLDEARMTQTQLAKRIGCSQSHINQLVYLHENANKYEWDAIYNRTYPVSYAFKFVKERREND